jgi:hypothetical protein
MNAVNARGPTSEDRCQKENFATAKIKIDICKTAPYIRPDYVIRRFNASSALVNKGGVDRTYAGTPLNAISRSQLEPM